jgi:hypothetical protein
VLTIGATLIIAAGVALVWVRVVETLTESSGGPRTIGQPGALVWDGRVFTAPAQLKSYLNSQGLSYKRWAARHPTAFGAPAPVVPRHTTKPKPTKIASKPAKSVTKTTRTATKTTHTATTPAKPVTHHVAAPTTTATKSQPLTSTVLRLLLLAAGLLLGASAALPLRYAPVAVQRVYGSPDRRMVALAAAAAILMGFGVSSYLS